MRIYLAGPLFTTAEHDFNACLTEALRGRRHEVWLPQENENRGKTARQIFDKDVEGIDWCEAVVACMDGPDPDSGACWECGYAYRKKRLLLFRTDFRVIKEAGDAPFNLMMSESADRCLDLRHKTIDDIAQCIDAVLREWSSARNRHE